MRITNLAVDDVPNVVWQGSNNLYCSLAVKEWTHRTPAVGDQKGSASWSTRVIDFPLDHEVNTNLQNKSVDTLSITILHENLVAADKTIGQGEISLSIMFPDIHTTPTYLCEEPIEFTVTAYEGAKFRNKQRGSIKFTASIMQCDFKPTDNIAVFNPKIPILKEKEKFEFRMGSSDSASLATHSIDPYTARDDHSSVYDFSSMQLRNAADILHTWEVPEQMPTCTDSTNNSNSNHSSTNNINNSGRNNSKNFSQTTPVSTTNSTAIPKIPTSVVPEVPQSTAAASKPRKLSSTAATAVSSIHKQAEPANSRSNSAVQEGAKSKTSKLNPTPPAPTTSSSSGISGTTRLRSRRATSTDASGEPPVVVPVAESTTTPTLRSRRSSNTAEGGKPALSTRTSSFNDPRSRPNTNVIPIKPTSIPTTTVTSTNKTDKVDQNQKYGTLTIDEAFRLAMRKRGAFVKLKTSEFAQLLAILHLPVRSELLQQYSSVYLSNLLIEQKEKLTQPVALSSTSSLEEEEINLPIVHAMSLAATISFAMRDGRLLQSDTVSATGRATPETESMVAMTESQSERALQQLMELVEGPYPAVKALILRICGGMNSTIGRASPALSTITGTSAVGGACRPSSWSAEQVQEFLVAIRVSSNWPDPDLTGDVLLCLDHSALRDRFGHNPSVDRTRLSVYLYLLKLLDQWWDRGIRPADCMEKRSVDALGGDGSGKLLEGGNRTKRSKRRGSKSGRFTHTWGDLSSVIHSWQQQQQSENGVVYNNSTRRVEDGRAVLNHLLKIDDFQALLEAMTPLNRAFGWGCSLDSLVRFASIIGGMRGYLWMKDTLTEETEGQRIKGSNYSAISAAATHSSSIEEFRSECSQPELSGTDEIVRWVVLQKSSAVSATELTQLIRLCSELKVVMKYASREDEFRVLIPVSCLRITSVQEIKDRKFESELQGLLLEDLDVGKHIVVASIEALTRTCERFDWWDRPSATALEAMSGRIGEVVSLVEAQDKRRVGVRMLDSGLCDALPLEALRLCTEPELLQLRSQQQNISSVLDTTVEEGRERGGAGEAGEGGFKKTVRRKSRAVVSESRKTRLRTLIRNLNSNENDTPTAPAITTHIPSKPTTAAVKAKKVLKPNEPPVLSEIEITTDTANKSVLSNLSDESSIEGKQEFVPINPVKCKKKSFSSKLNLSSPISPTLNTPILNKPIAAPPAPAPHSPASPTTKHISPQKPIIRRTRVMNTAMKPLPVGNQIPPSQDYEVSETERGLQQHQQQDQEVETFIPADYSWLRASKRNPLSLHTTGTGNHDSDDVLEGPSSDHQQFQHQPTLGDMGSPVGNYPETSKKPSSIAAAPIHVIQQSFDSEHAEYTDGVLRGHVSHTGGNNRQTIGNKFVRHNRPQSVPSTSKKRNINEKIEKQDENQYIEDSHTNAINTTTSFGLSGVGYVSGGGGLAQHANQWVNEEIPVFSDSEQPKKPINKHSLHTKQRESRQETQKLFDYHERQLDPMLFSPDEGKNKQLLNFMLGTYTHDQQGSSGNNNDMYENRTNRIKQRPKSANPTSRGVNNPRHHSNSSSNNHNSADTSNRHHTTDIDTILKLDNNKAEKKELSILNIEGTTPPVVQSSHIEGHTNTKKPSSTTTNAPPPTTTTSASSNNKKKKTREEELHHIATAQSNKEMQLKEKVLMRELKRLQGKS